jgi:predicted nuclease of restriction endonuclease-like (RecB) superfamily
MSRVAATEKPSWGSEYCNARLQHCDERAAHSEEYFGEVLRNPLSVVTGILNTSCRWSRREVNPMVEDGSAQFAVTPARSTLPEWYPELLATVTQRVSDGRTRAMAAANQQLVATYWAIGRDILERQHQEGWGSRVIERLSVDLREKFPESKGFSPRNLKYMRAFAEAWPKASIVQAPLAQLPWYHQIALIEKVSGAEARLWYAIAAVNEGWSRSTLVHQIETRLHERSGRAVTNFEATLPPEDSDLAQQMTKDPYVFDFAAMTDRHNERELETQLVAHVRKFLLELGQGFAFVGEQVRLEVGGDEFFADLLFYHLRLRCYVVIELKATPFDPGFVGQLGMYMAAVDDLLALEAELGGDG